VRARARARERERKFQNYDFSGKRLDIFTLERKSGVTKYLSKNAKELGKLEGLTQQEQLQFEALSSLSLTKETWNSYRTAERMLAKCCKERKVKFEWPVAEVTITKVFL
jgi:hypothetical protein